MIQRIQTIYLLLVAIACIAFFSIPAGVIQKPDGTVANWQILSILPVVIIVVIIAVVALAAIFMYKNRQNQMKLVLLNIIFSVVMIGVLGFELVQHIGIAHYSFRLGIILPIFILLFNSLAYGSIKGDEKLVRSMDRLR